MLSRRIKVQLVAFTVVALVAGTIMVIGYGRVPAMVFGIGRYDVVIELSRAAGLYESANVTYSGTEVGRVTDVELTDGGVRAVLSLGSNTPIPADVVAEVHSQSAIGEQFVALVPRSTGGPALKDGDVIPTGRTTTPPDVGDLLDATNRGLQAIPREDLQTAIDESYLAVAGLGPEISRIVKGSTALAIDADANLDSLTTLIDTAHPLLDAQGDTAPEIQQWARHIAVVTAQLEEQDAAVAGVLRDGARAAAMAQQLIDQLKPTLPVLLANLVSVNEVLLSYQPALEQLLVLLPQGEAVTQGIGVANANTQQDYKGFYLDFNLNLNLPPPCLTGFLPNRQQRDATFEDYPDRPAGDLYCRTPQDSPWNVRGAKNLPCLTVPGKRAPTVALCESNEQYVPLNDGQSWKGDPNATLTGQDVPQLPPPTGDTALPPPPPAAAAFYDPATGVYSGPDGRTYQQGDLANGAAPRTWQSMLLPPATP